MKAIGLIVEYNPLHNGHAYHLRASRDVSGADIVICVMSGYFLQRGEPAAFSRRVRTEMALSVGADLVVELPYAYSTQHAHWFARGGVSILDDLFADEFYFGSEAGHIDDFHELDTFMHENTQCLQEKVRAHVKSGISYPSAQARAFFDLNPPAHLPDLSQPNNILGYHYVKAASRQLGARIASQTIPRISAAYHDDTLPPDQSIASATAIRKMLSESGDAAIIRPYVPEQVYEMINRFYVQDQPMHEWEAYYPYLQLLLSTRSAEALSRIYEAEEGLENRLIKTALTQPTFHDFMHAAKTKRYTWTRLQRLSTHILTGTAKTDIDEALGVPARPRSVRILGFSESGRAYLNRIKKHTPLSLYHRPPQNKNAQQWLDERAARAYYAILNGSERVDKWKEEYTQPPVYPD
ncbi:nucleotidyltransferase [Natribacillus halophilus]|uniref:tRNA(Met) cytidine acetate ligase n=1 Tax=Natribacillus halophilus TaxID=549003 RepID=A0A1G8ME12_9BACI|nr:nucleotidyltransferase [Natribacillus halophilus]SDI66142.1 Predicted nucleotidyltransferase [Natribacillus halophilus]